MTNGFGPQTQDFEAFDGPPWLRKLLFATSPVRVASRLARFLPSQYLPTQIYLGSLKRPSYAYGVYTAAIQAKALGYPRFSVIEFGVARPRLAGPGSVGGPYWRILRDIH